LPVSESFGFTGALRAATSGQAFPQAVFDHWEPINGDPMVEGKAQELVLAIRKRKNLKVVMPDVNDYNDKL
jgi:elongation factor 2